MHSGSQNRVLRRIQVTSRTIPRDAVAPRRVAASLALVSLIAACSGETSREPLDRSAVGVTSADSTIITATAPAGGPAGEDSAYLEFQVEAPVAAEAGGAAPIYSDALRKAGVTGMVLVQFVVDTVGRAEPATFKVLKTSRAEFSMAVREALPGMRFTPARFEGRKVRQLVQQPFVFALER